MLPVHLSYSELQMAFTWTGAMFKLSAYFHRSPEAHSRCSSPTALGSEQRQMDHETWACLASPWYSLTLSSDHRQQRHPERGCSLPNVLGCEGADIVDLLLVFKVVVRLEPGHPASLLEEGSMLLPGRQKLLCGKTCAANPAYSLPLPLLRLRSSLFVVN